MSDINGVDWDAMADWAESDDVFEPPVRAVPELNYPYGPMAESHHYIARRANCKQGYAKPLS